MKKILGIIVGAAIALASCTNEEESTWDKYRDWRELNDAWLLEMQAKTNADGSPFYTVIVPEWNPGTFVLMHWFDGRDANADNLTPLYTSTVDVRYQLHLCNDTMVDCSDELTAYGQKGIFRTKISSLIPGWAIAMENMHCGDSVEIIVPYGAAYAAQTNGNIDPYSNLRFNIRLVDIPYYEKAPY
ncbi:MAG: FKBP-type peptidyl-prolyl cis-trans isomerase [Muribaculaceae bacterium]|nr:FKBP-type peptidyl-prolyl cis-trans isomerase [Muribaculaceae bacterium]